MLLVQREGIGLQCDVDATEIAYVLANRKCAVDMRHLVGVVGVLLAQLHRHELVVLVDKRLRELLEMLAVLVGPPILEFAAAVELGAWSSKPWPISWPITVPMPP